MKCLNVALTNETVAMTTPKVLGDLGGHQVWVQTMFQQDGQHVVDHCSKLVSMVLLGATIITVLRLIQILRFKAASADGRHWIHRMRSLFKILPGIICQMVVG